MMIVMLVVPLVSFVHSRSRSFARSFGRARLLDDALSNPYPINDPFPLPACLRRPAGNP